MQKKKVLFYIQVPFLDINLEIINLIKNKYDLHVLIELPESVLKVNVLNLNINLEDCKCLTSFWSVADKWKISYLTDFFNGCVSVDFVIYKSKNRLNSLYITTKEVIKYIKNIEFNFYHFDDFSARQAFILPFINIEKRLILNIHDPFPHKGEFEWKRYLIKKIFYCKVQSFITFSYFSKKKLEEMLNVRNKVFVFNLLPYTVFRKFQGTQNKILDKDKYIAFVGRLSPYKGVDLFLESIKDILKEFPDQKFLIAGRPSFGYSPNFEILGNLLRSVTIIERHLNNNEVVDLISKSKLIVCPYLEATQSGVIMTAYALNCPVLITNVGGLAESVRNNVTGLIANEISAQSISLKIKEFLENDMYYFMQNNLQKNVYISELIKFNIDIIDTAYSQKA